MGRGEKKSDDNDSYAKFLKNRKPVDAKVEAAEMDEGGADNDVGGGMTTVTWSSDEDIALLNALKAFV
ncbi:unnamed protein product [Linum trigynum]|uniref:Uncharacterized protein n=1 Tax=Linum trigynum TaxID=586398 RepID=A0AAV2GD69_9ROSI